MQAETKKNYRFHLHRTKLHRPALWKSTKEAVKPYKVDRKNRIIDPNTKRFTYTVDYGHKRSYENKSMMAAAERVGMSQRDFSRMMNNPNFYQLEDSSSNRSGRYEEKDPNIRRQRAFEEIRKFYGKQPRLAERRTQQKTVQTNTGQKASQTQTSKQSQLHAQTQKAAQTHKKGRSH